MATHAVALLLGCIRGIPGTHALLSAGGWSQNPIFRASCMAGRTLGIVGLGNIGCMVARKLSGCGMRLLVTDPFVESERAAKLKTKGQP